MRKVLSIITLISLFMIMGATTIKNEESISEFLHLKHMEFIQ